MPSSQRKWFLGLSVIICAGVVAFAFQQKDDERVAEVIVFDTEQVESGEIWKALEKPEPDVVVNEPADALSLLDQEERCYSVFAEGSRSNLGLVVSSSEKNRSKYSVYGDDGLVLEGDLPFIPNKQFIAQREDGSHLIAVADLRLNSKVLKDPSVDEPVRVYLDDQLIYQTEKALDLGVAPSGEGFYVLEPSASDTTQLHIYNLDTGNQYEVNLGYARQSIDNEITSSLRYSPTGNEIELISRHGHQSTFFPMTGGKPTHRNITYDEAHVVLYASSYIAYTAYHEQGVWKPIISKLRFESTGSNQYTVEWFRKLEDMSTLYEGALELQGNGEWLVINGSSHIKVLATETGQTKFSYNRDEDAQKKALAHVASSSNARPGRISQVLVADDQVRFQRLDSHIEVDLCYMHAQADLERGLMKSLNECIEVYRQAGMHQEYYDHFPADEDGNFASAPSHRTMFEPNSICGNGIGYGAQLALDESGHIRVERLGADRP